jgi:hypothetical protein
MRECPTCGAVVDGLYCLKCSAGKTAKATDPDWWRCADTDAQGQRCSRPGALTESTRGAERWHCHLHYAPFRGRGYGIKRAPPPQGWRNAVPTQQARPVAAISEDLLERAAIQGELA